MSIALIGGAGFVGTRLFERLKRRGVACNIYDIKTNSSNFIQYFDVTSEAEFKNLSGNEVIINLAAEHRDDVRPITKYDDVNVHGAQNVCNAANLLGINKIIFTSSVAIYGFAPPGTVEDGEPNYFNDYGRTKYLAESIYKEWQAQDPSNRTLVIVRPTVIFGEGNRGNVYNLLNQIASRRFLMFGDGKNIKSMAYVENVASFLEYCISFTAGVHIYNYIDKPDLDMNGLIIMVRKILFSKDNIGIRFPKELGITFGYIADLFSKILGRPLPISSIRVKKFMGTTQFGSAVDKTGFVAPITLEEGLSNTLRYEFIEDNFGQRTFDTE